MPVDEPLLACRGSRDAFGDAIVPLRGRITGLRKNSALVQAEHLSADAGSALDAAAEPAPVREQDVDDAAIERALAEHAGNVTAAARALGLHRNQLRRRSRLRTERLLEEVQNDEDAREATEDSRCANVATEKRTQAVRLLRQLAVRILSRSCAIIFLPSTSPTCAWRAPGFRAPRPVVRRMGARLYVLSVTLDHHGQVMIGVTPVSARRVAAHLKRVKHRLGK